MDSILSDIIKQYRAQTFRTTYMQRITSKEQAIKFVNDRGFVYFWRIKGVVLPSLWVAVAGDHPVANAHDDPGHLTWRWKDSLLGKNAWYYARILRKKATMISFEVVPYFYALSNNFGSFEDDYLTLYEQGRLTQEAKSVYETLLEKGPLDTIELRRETHLTSRTSDSRFDRAMVELQSDFKILPVGVTQSGGWRYAFAYDIVQRYYPDIPQKAQNISEIEARQKLSELYFCSVGAARLKDLVRLFRWSRIHVEHSVEELIKQGFIRSGFEAENQPDEWFVLSELL
ncbi:MAG: hypothetical protein WBB55_12155 [Anaerolineales bacterium]